MDTQPTTTTTDAQHRAEPSPFHWIGMAGLYGYLPQTCDAYDTAKDAAEALADLHELGKSRRRRLLASLDANGETTFDLNLYTDGNEYIEISRCDCGNRAQSHRSAHAMIKVYRPTRYPELGYRQDGSDLWRIVETEDSRAIGPQYRTKAELLADLDRYATEYGATGAAPRPTRSRPDAAYFERVLTVLRALRDLEQFARSDVDQLIEQTTTHAIDAGTEP